MHLRITGITPMRAPAHRHERENCVYGLGLRCNEIIDRVRCCSERPGSCLPRYHARQHPASSVAVTCVIADDPVENGVESTDLTAEQRALN
jgi:hypothetical protein